MSFFEKDYLSKARHDFPSLLYRFYYKILGGVGDLGEPRIPGLAERRPPLLASLLLRKEFGTVTHHVKGLFPLPPTASHFCRLLDSFDVVPGHLTEDLHLYSLNDLTATKKGELGPRLAELTRAGAAHVERCMVRPPCSAQLLRPCSGLRWGSSLPFSSRNLIGQLTLRRNQKALLFSKSVNNRFFLSEELGVRGGSFAELGQEGY